MEAKKNRRGISARQTVGLGQRLKPMTELAVFGRTFGHDNPVGATVGEGPSRAHAGRGARVSK